MKSVIESKNTRIERPRSTHPGIRYTSGLTVYDEALVNGRLISRFWSTDGHIPQEAELEIKVNQLRLLPLESFHLVYIQIIFVRLPR